MNALWQNPIVVLAVMAWLSASPKTLSEASQREAFRRQLAGRPHASLTNIGQPMEIPLVAAAATPPDSGDAQAQAGAPAGDKAAADKAAADKAAVPAKDEKWWREKIGTANDSLKRDQMMNDALQSRINALKRDSVNFDDPNKQRKAREELNAAMTELDRNQKMIEEDKKAISMIQDDARRMNVPASWVR